ncbi:GtrA family protein [Pseudarthrobacter sulfonivorans]|uniref:GtrA family protein n=1 Tax=Pseudarthrobacter sulfonivorans TaxID=121292 RepID=UPI002107B59D|nr:GtrA family protein [Pseudarthrobacter sulfonivorans]
MKQPEAPDEAVKGIPSGPPGPLLRIIKDERVAFILVGGANTAFSTALFIVIAWLYPGLPSPAVLSIAFVVSLVSVFFVYRKLVFRVEGHFWLDLGRFTLVNLTMFFTNMALLFVAHEVLGYPQIPSQIAITCVTVIINYFGHKYFSFRRSPEPVTPKKKATEESTP